MSRLVGLISDTHSLIRPQALDALAGVDLILHAGDVGGQTVILALERIAPVRAVYGNVDPIDGTLAESLRLEVEGISIHLTHGHELGSPTPDALLDRYDAAVIVFGHTHRAVVFSRGSRLAVNPGAAGPRRFDTRPSVARLRIENGAVTAEIVPLPV